MSDDSPPPQNLGSILGGSGAAILSALGVIYTAINHKRVKAKCCGKQFEVELDIGSTEEGSKQATTTAETATAPKVSAKVHPEPDLEKGTEPK